MNQMVLIYSLFRNAGEAHDCCRTLLHEKLIASANRLVPAITYLSVNDDVETIEQHPVFFSTVENLAETTIARISELNRNPGAATVSIPLSHSNIAFSDWVKTQIQS